MIDAAIDKIGRLVGGCAPVCSNRAAQAELEAFFRGVPVGAVSWGMESFVRCYLDSLLTYGNAVGEIVVAADGKSVAGLYNAPLRNIAFRDAGSPFGVQVCAAKDGARPRSPSPGPSSSSFRRLTPRPGSCAAPRCSPWAAPSCPTC